MSGKVYGTALSERKPIRNGPAISLRILAALLLWHGGITLWRHGKARGKTRPASSIRRRARSHARARSPILADRHQRHLLRKAPRPIKDPELGNLMKAAAERQLAVTALQKKYAESEHIST